jgi:hypothetical protein
MRHPTKVKIGPFSFTIEFNKSTVERLSGKTKERFHGLTAPDELLIAVAPTVTPLEREVLMHEILHAICFTSGLTGKLDTSQEEDIVSTLSPYLLDILRNNKQVTQFLLED